MMKMEDVTAAVRAAVLEDLAAGPAECSATLSAVSGLPAGAHVSSALLSACLQTLRAAERRADADVAETERQIALLRLALALSLALCSRNDANTDVRRLPFLLLEESVQTARGAEAVLRLWTAVESDAALRAGLTHPQLFGAGALVLLRTCNALLRHRLSKARQTQICGRVLMFLSAAFPLSERSAVNLMGKANVGNRTEYDSEEAWHLHDQQDADDEEDEGEGDEGSVAIVGTSNTPTTNSGASNTLVSFLQYLPEDERARFVETAAGAGAQSEGGTAAKQGQELPEQGEEREDGEEEEEQPNATDYALYKTFWGLQGYMLQPPATSFPNAQVWRQFVREVDLVLRALETTRFSETERKQMVERWQQRRLQAVPAPRQRRRSEFGLSQAVAEAIHQPQQPPGDGEDGGEEAYYGCKYLTNSRLFQLQLRDPTLRMQVLMQVLILFKRILAVPPALPGVQLDEQLRPLRTRTRALLHGTPPNGPEFVHILDTLLEREANWVSWKADKKCAPFEREAAADETVAAQPARDIAVTARDADAKIAGAMKAYEHVQLQDIAPGDVRSMTEDMQSMVPSFDAFVGSLEQAVRDGEDEEDEFHPKHDKIFCWRAQRLLMQTSVHALELDGDMVKALRNVRGDALPPPPKPKPKAKTASSSSNDNKGATAQPDSDGKQGESTARKVVSVSGGRKRPRSASSRGGQYGNGSGRDDEQAAADSNTEANGSGAPTETSPSRPASAPESAGGSTTTAATAAAAATKGSGSTDGSAGTQVDMDGNGERESKPAKRVRLRK